MEVEEGTAIRNPEEGGSEGEKEGGRCGRATQLRERCKEDHGTKHDRRGVKGGGLGWG